MPNARFKPTHWELSPASRRPMRTRASCHPPSEAAALNADGRLTGADPVGAQVVPGAPVDALPRHAAPRPCTPPRPQAAAGQRRAGRAKNTFLHMRALVPRGRAGGLEAVLHVVARYGVVVIVGAAAWQGAAHAWVVPGVVIKVAPAGLLISPRRPLKPPAAPPVAAIPGRVVAAAPPATTATTERRGPGIGKICKAGVQLPGRQCQSRLP